MTRAINDEAEAMAVIQTLRVTCQDCGHPFAFRTAQGPKKAKPKGPQAAIEWLCDACFDRWCWEHEPIPPGSVPESAEEERCDE